MNTMLHFDRLARYLLPLSLIYLALPHIIFFAGWLKWYLALPCILFVSLIPLYALLERGWVAGEAGAQPELPALRPNHITLVLVMALLLLGVSGIGGYGYQDSDWYKHNAILKDLIERPWPVRYKHGAQELPLVYYLAYYLPPAILGKSFGWFPANQVLFIWSLVGLVLAILWFLVLNRRAAFTVILVLVAFSGLDVIGQSLVTPTVAAIRPEYAELMRWDHIERWSIGWQYSAHLTQLFWVPNQALAGWIASGALAYSILFSPRKTYHLALWGLTAFWSPFVTLGLSPYLLADILTEQGRLTKRLKKYLSLPNLCGLSMMTFVGLFYSAKFYEIPSFAAAEIPHGFSLSFAPDAQAKLIGATLILVFCFLEFGLYAILIYRNRQAWNAKTKALFLSTMLCLALLPLYVYGGANDLTMRASIPALFVLALFLSMTLHSESLSLPTRLILILLIILGSCTAWIEIRRHIMEIHGAGKLLNLQESSQVLSLWDFPVEGPDSLIRQYIGSSEAPFFRFLTR